MPIFQIKRIISREKWFNYVITIFFFKCPKFGSVTTLNGEKKEDAWPKAAANEESAFHC